MPNKQSNTVSTAKELETQIKALNISELQTVFDIAAESQVQFTEQVLKAKGSAENAEMLYQWAKNVANNQLAEKRAQQLRHDPLLQGLTKLNTQEEAKPLRASAKTLADNNIPERTDKYAQPSSIQSMFSPGRYLCELYNVAQELHAKENSLHIDKRRPDLQTLILSDAVAQQEVSTLDILLETLQSKINLTDLAASEKYDQNTFILPYDDNLTIINAVLESKSTSLRDIAAQLADNQEMQAVKLTPALVQEQLGLNPTSYDLIKTELSKPDSDNQRLAHATKLSVDQLQILITQIKTNNSKSDSNEETILTVLSEYVRLNRRYALTAKQFGFIINTKDAETTSGDKKTTSQSSGLGIIAHLFGINYSQVEMLLTLCGKSEMLKNMTQGQPLDILAAISELENIVQWMSEQKLDLATLNAMLTDKYSATATPELFNFLSNIYHSVDTQADAELLKQSLCRSLAAGFHLKTEVIAGLVKWLESNDTDFSLEKFSQAITEVFNNIPTLEELEHHSELVTQCQKLSQYVLIAQWAKLTPQDIDLLLQPKLVNGNEKPLQPGLPLLRLLADFKAWQQQVKVPVSEALRYFSLFSTHTQIDKLTEENNDLIKQLATAEKNHADKNQDYNKITNKVKDFEQSIEKSKEKINNIQFRLRAEKKIISEIETEINELLKKGTDTNRIALYHDKLKEANKYLNVTLFLLDDAHIKQQAMISSMQELNIERDKLKNGSDIKNIEKQIKAKREEIDKVTQPAMAMLIKIHDWDQQHVNEIIENIFPKQYPVQFISVNKLCKYINILHQLDITRKDLLNINSLALEKDNNELKSVIKITANGLI